MTSQENNALLALARELGEVTGAVESLRDEFVDFRTEMRASLRLGSAHFKEHDDEIAALKESQAEKRGETKFLRAAWGVAKKPTTWVVVAVGTWLGLFGPGAQR